MIDRIKRRAKEIKRAKGIKHTAALDYAAQEKGFENYKQALIQIKRDLTAQP